MIKTAHTTPSGFRLAAAFLSIYLVWGSTYLAIHFAIQSMPPLLMLGARFAVAGLLVYAWARWKGISSPSLTEWKSAWIVGTLTLGIGTGAVAWAEQWVASGVVALLVTTVPLWMVLLEWKWKGGPRPGAGVWLGIVLGLFGVFLLVDPASLSLEGPERVYGALAVFLAALSWSFGAILGREMRLPSRPLMSTATQMIAGAGSLVVFGLIRGEWADLSVADITVGSWAAWAYLMFFGSIVAYGSFVWLMKNVDPARVSTYAYVNPVVAVFLGWALAGERVDAGVLVAIAFLFAALVLTARSGRSVSRRGHLAPVSRTREILTVFARSLDRPATSLPRRVGREAQRA